MIVLIDVVDQSFGPDDFLHKLRKCLPLPGNPFRNICYQSTVKINFHQISRFYYLCGLRTLNNRQPDVDGIAVKDSGKCLCNHTAAPWRNHIRNSYWLQ